VLDNQFIEAERVLLRPLEDTDTEFIMALLNTDGWIQNIGQRHIHSVADALAYIRKIQNNPQLAYRVIELRTDRTPIGLVTFIQRDYLDSPDIGFALLPAYERQGYAYEASRCVLDRIAQAGAYREVLGICVESNEPSIRLLERLGLRFREKIEHDDEVLNLYAVRWAQ
jgi:[ribosomal protein S5]-alanine N-acetyltransferase